MGSSNVAIIDGVGNLKTLIAAQDNNGNLAPAHLIVDINGAAILPAQDSSIGTDGSSPPSLPGGSTGVRGWLRYIGSLLSGPLQITVSGSVGTDSSPNLGTAFIPNLGANFANSGPYANYTLLQTVNVNLARSALTIRNISGVGAVVVRDDGTANSSVSLNNASLFPLSPGEAGIGFGGESYVITTFKGRAQIYGQSNTALITVCQD